MSKLIRTRRKPKYPVFRHRLWLVGLFVALILFIPNLKLHAATLASASVSLSDPRPNQLTVSYNFNATVPASAAIKCIKMQFTDTATGAGVPAGMNTTVAAVALDAANTNYVPTPASWALNKTTNGTLLLTNATGETPATGANRHVEIDGITNGNTADTKYWLKFNTYNNTDCTSNAVDNATVQYIYTNASTLTLTVDNTLSFTVNAVAAAQACDGTTTTAASTATTIPFGTVTAASNAVVCQDLTAATNATSGYTIYARYTAAPTNALSQTIANHTGTNAAPTAFSAAGTEAYGYSTNDASLGTGTVNRFTNPSQNWAAMTTSNAEVAYEPAAVTSTTYRVGHQVGVSLVTRPGTYSTTVIYTCTPIY